MKCKKRKHRSLRKRESKNKLHKQRNFSSDGASKVTNQIGLQNERIRIYCVYFGLILGLIIGFVLTIMNVTDSSFALEYGNAKLRATLVGFVIVIGCIWALCKFNANTSITNEHD